MNKKSLESQIEDLRVDLNNLKAEIQNEETRKKDKIIRRLALSYARDFKAGDKVRILKGYYVGIIATVVYVCIDPQGLKLRLPLNENIQHYDLFDFWDVEKVENGGATKDIDSQFETPIADLSMHKMYHP